MISETSKKSIFKPVFFLFCLLFIQMILGCTLSTKESEVTLTSIEIKTAPKKTTYTQGEFLDLTGLEVQAVYSNKDRKNITEYIVNPAVSEALNTLGTITVTIIYEKKTATFEITVNKSQSSGQNTPKITSIQILNKPSKLEYVEGEFFSIEGLVVQGVYSDGTKENISGWSITPKSGTELSGTGTKTVTVAYTGFTTSFTITVNARPSVIADSFFWGTWVRMDNGKQYEFLEDRIKANGSNYYFSSENSSGSEKSVTAFTLGTFTRQSDSVIVNDNIPYFRNGGTNLDYSLKIVGFSNSRAVSHFGAKGYKGTGKSDKFKTFKSEGESDDDGFLKLTAPTINDVQTVTLDLNDGDGGLIVIPGIKVANTGDYMGTVALVDENQYNLKITGTISDDQKDDGYLYGNNFKPYHMVLTIKNISKVKSSSSYCTITATDSRLRLSSDFNLQAVPIASLDAGFSKDIEIDLIFDEMSEAYVDTGLDVKISNPIQGLEWSDYVPLRFYKGLIPITVAAKSTEGNVSAGLNGFVIYPDGNSQYFSVPHDSSEILLVPTFGLDKQYKMVFSGATMGAELASSTEMFYSVAPGSSKEKEINLNVDGKTMGEYFTYGGNNNTEKDAFEVKSEFIAYLEEGTIDYYCLNADSEEFYAPGAKNFYRVSFESDYGTVPSSFFMGEGTTIPLEKLPALENEGMTFLGWYAGNTLVKSGEYRVVGNVTLSASWKYTAYSVEYELNGGAAGSVDEAKNNSLNPASFTIRTAEITLKAPSRTGYDFMGWFINSDCTGTAVEKIAGGAIGNVKLYASWKSISYKINYVLNGGTAGSADEAKNAAENPAAYTIEQNVSIKAAIRDGYAFAGWFKNSSFTGNRISSIEKGTTGELTLYARWLKRCTVTYVSAHGTAPSAFIKGETDTFTEEELPVLSEDGWLFKGWYVSGSAGEAGNKVEAGVYVVQGDLTLTAKWVEACRITYSSEKAVDDVPASIVVEKGSALSSAELPRLREKGFKMTGWFDGSTKISAGYVVETNLSLAAVWEEYTGPDDGFIFVEGGTFQMGSESGDSDEKPVHSVTVSDFYISPYELTQGEYEELCCYTSSSPSSSYGYGSQYPVYYVSWYDALVYCNLKSMQEGLTPSYIINGGTDPKNWPGIKTISGKYSCSYTSNNSTWDAVICDFTADGYRLPTEAEWEYAANGGKKSQGYTYSGSNTVDDVGWYTNNSGNKTHQVGTKNKNELDLYDMSGNVWEWCWDWYGSYSSDSTTDPIGAFSGSYPYRVDRGGSWYKSASGLCVAFRSYGNPYGRGNSLGFRLVRSANRN